MPPVDIRYQPRLRDYFEAVASAARHSRFVAGMGAYLCVSAGIMILLWGDKASMVMLLVGVLFLTGYVPAAVSLLAAWRRRSVLTREVALIADARGVRSMRAGAKSEIDWSAFRRVRDLRTAFLLDFGTGGGNIVPKKAFDAESLDRFRALAREAGVLDASSPAIDLFIGGVIGAVVAGLFMMTMIALNQA